MSADNEIAIICFGKNDYLVKHVVSCDVLEEARRSNINKIKEGGKCFDNFSDASFEAEKIYKNVGVVEHGI